LTMTKAMMTAMGMTTSVIIGHRWAR